MRQKVGFIKSVLWAVVILTALILMLILSIRVLASEPSVERINLEPAAEEQVTPPPEISIRQRDGHLRASASVEASEWRYAGPNATTACDSAFFATTETVRTGREVVLDSADYGRYYCFRAAVDDDYIYHPHLVVDNRPQFVIEQDLNAAGESVLRTVSAQPAAGWQSVGPLAVESCMAASFDIVGISPQSGSELSIGIDPSPDYYCFKARGLSGEWGFAGRQLETDRLEFIWQNADGLLEVTSENWPADRIGEYVIKDAADSSCSMEDFADREGVGSGNSIPVDSASAGYYCFRVKDTGHAYHYSNYLSPR